MLSINVRKVLSSPPNKAFVALVIFFLPTTALPSPWLEANDPFLRSSLVLLSDSGQISSPVNHYPIRWSLLGGELTYVDQDSDMIMLANHELLYNLNSAKLNRGNRLFKILNATRPSSPLGFGQFNEDEKGIYTSIEYLGNSISYRLSAGYSEYQDDTTLSLDDSYVTLNSGPWLWSLGNIDRWWGQGWQHNLILGSYAKAAPDISASYIGDNSALGVWSIESLLAQPDNSDYEYHSATRLVSKPFEIFEYGITYQTWFSDVGSNQDEQQLSLDAKLTLPNIASLYHSAYAEAASTSDTSELGAWLVGWTGGFPIGENTGRIVLESQKTTSAHNTTPWKAGTYPSTTNNVANTTYPLDDSMSIAFYLQLKNDHQIGVISQRSTLNANTKDISQLIYNLPALAGMVRVGASFEKMKESTNQTNLWAGYEFRF
ncbi:capsule assembly Wzi family protein [Marinomonas primoryensis]|uniref:capsule assembly Wzi family protein n=1 Tax=Marinomonas primoryensis TaxID=178399 RepID=UPI000DD46066|nr:capsule assembly Wzi family protein [Marinomonas primoryensis]